MNKKSLLITVTLTVMLFANAGAQPKPIGIFDGQADVGPVKLKGSAVYNGQTKQYVVSASGADVFFERDELHFVWKKIKGDFTLSANGAFIGADTHMYGKFGLMVRKSLAGNSAQVNAVVHGNKLTSLQWRKTTADSTYEQRTDVLTANVLKLERRGNVYTMWVSHVGEDFAAPQKIEVNMGEEVYVGLFVCSHVADKIKQATFSNVQLDYNKRPITLHGN